MINTEIFHLNICCKLVHTQYLPIENTNYMRSRSDGVNRFEDLIWSWKHKWFIHIQIGPGTLSRYFNWKCSDKKNNLYTLQFCDISLLLWYFYTNIRLSYQMCVDSRYRLVNLEIYLGKNTLDFMKSSQQKTHFHQRQFVYLKGALGDDPSSFVRSMFKILGLKVRTSLY